MFKNKLNNKRLWLSLILSLICATLLCCALILPKINKNTETASAATVNPEDAVVWESIANYQYYQYPCNDNSNYGKVLQVSNMSTSVNGEYGVSTFDADNATAYGSKIIKQNLTTCVAAYIHFKATVTIPAYTEYTVDFSETMYLNAITPSSAGSWLAWADFYAYGETDTSSDVSFGYVTTKAGATKGYVTPEGVNRVHNSATSTTAGSNKTYPAKSVYSDTYTNETNLPQEKTVYFGFYVTTLPSSAYHYTVNGNAKMTADITITKINAPTADKTSAIYDASGNTFTFTDYDTNRLDYTVSFKDTENTVTDITNSTNIDTDGKCKLKDAGTYTFTFKIKDNCGAVWNSATNDRTDKTVTITINRKMLTAPSGTVETEYNGENQSLGTLSSPPSWYEATAFEDTSIIAMDDEFIDASENEVTVTLVDDGYCWSDYASNSTNKRTFKFNIKKKKLEVTFDASKGHPVAKYDETQLYDRDKVDERKPELITKYSKDGSLDGATLNVTGLGNWYAIAVMGTGYNYYVDAKYAFTATKQSVNVPSLGVGADAVRQYNSAEQTFVLEGFNSAIMDYIAPDGAVRFDGKNLVVKAIGTYEVTYTLTNTQMYEWADTTTGDKTVTVEIVKKQLEVEFEDNGGVLSAKFKDENEIYADDKVNGKPTFKLITKYSKDGSAENATYTTPDSSGVWYAHAFIDTDCNYTVSSEGRQFTLEKIKLAYPVLADADDATKTYDGTEQAIYLDNYVASAMSYAVPDGAELEYDSITGDLKVKVKNAGEYTFGFTLINTSLYEWISEAPIKITVEPKKVQINADENNPTSWEKDGNTRDMIFTVPTVLCDGDASLKLVGVCTKNGTEQKPAPAVVYADGKYTLTVPAYSRGKYSLTVKVADGENYSGSSQEVTFEITGVGIDIGYNDIVWKINGESYTVADETEEAEIEYSGKPFTLTADFSASEYAVDLSIVGDIGGDWTEAIDTGSYTATVRIASTNPELIFDKEFTLKIKIVPKELTFEDAEWQWRYTDSEEWNALADKSMPSFDNKAVEVRLSPEYLSGLGLKDGDYTLNYINSNDMTEKGDKTTSAEITVTNPNFTAGTDGYIKITKNWKITAKAVKYSWTGTQTITAGEKTFEFPAIVFEDGGDYSQHFEYYYKIDGDEDTEYTKVQIERYLRENWSETTVITGSVCVRVIGDDSEVVIAESSRAFTTGTPKTPLEVKFESDGSEYGKVDFSFEVLRGGSDESARTAVTVSGGAIDGEKTFNGDSAEFKEFIKTLGAGSYKITVSVNGENSDSYTLTGETSFTFEIARFRITEDMWNKDGKEGAVLDLPDFIKEMLSDGEVLKVNYSYFAEKDGEALAEVVFEAGKTYFVNATLTGSASGNFEFENGEIADGRPTSAKTDYTVPEDSGIGAFFGSVGKFVKDNLLLVIGVCAGLLLLILLLIIIIAVKKKRALADGYDDYDEYDYDEDDDEEDYEDEDDYDDYDDDYDGDYDY